MTEDYRTTVIKELVARAESRVISQRTHVGTLRVELAEAERDLGVLERELAEARGLAVELGVVLDDIDLGPGTTSEMFKARVRASVESFTDAHADPALA